MVFSPDGEDLRGRHLSVCAQMTVIGYLLSVNRACQKKIILRRLGQELLRRFKSRRSRIWSVGRNAGSCVFLWQGKLFQPYRKTRGIGWGTSFCARRAQLQPTLRRDMVAFIIWIMQNFAAIRADRAGKYRIT